MKDSKLYQTLSTFDVYELNRLKKFIDSPYFNSNDKISHLFNILYDHLKDNGEHKLDKGSLFAQIMPNEAYEDRKFRKLTSDLLKLIENFLSIEEYEKNPLHKVNYLFRAIQEHKLETLYNSTVRTARRLASRQLNRSSSFYYYQYQIEKNYYELSEAVLNRSERSNIDSIIQNLDYFYLAEKLKYYCGLLSRKKIQKHDYEILFIQEILDHIEAHDYSDQPQILVFHDVYKLHENLDNVDNYYSLKEFIKDHQDIFEFEDLEVIYLTAINFCIGNANKGKHQFLTELLEIYKFALKDKIVFTDGEISPWSFFNIVLTGLRVGEYDWVEYFINNYNKFLNEKYRENALTFNKARLFYYRKDYEKVIPLLNEVEFTDFSYNLSAKALLLATFYELDEMETLDSFLDTFRTFLNRKKNSLPESRRRNYLNLIKFTKKLTNIYPDDKEAIQDLKKEIEDNQQIADSSWLKEKIRELESKAVH